MNNRESVLDNKCPHCKAPLTFNPKLGKWSCEYCDSVFTLEELQKYNNASSLENNNNEGGKSVDTTQVSYRCKNCGAEIITDEQTAATFCIYCGNTAILKSKLSNEFAPDMIIPFKTERQKAIETFKKLAKGKPLVPKDFISEKNIEKIKGVYIPFWLYDIKVDGTINCNARKVNSWTVGNTHYTKTSLYKLYRTGGMNFYGIPVDGSTRFDNAIMNSIEPFKYEDLENYNHAYLSGFFAEKYDVNSEDAFIDAKNRGLESAKNIMLNDSVGYISKSVFENTLNTEIIKKQYIMLPVWMVNVKYKDKMYIFAMNGQTGKFIGNIPLDKKKTVIYSILIFIITFALCVLVSYLIYRGTSI
ncbi:MAG: hypothetical protein NC181_03030 [Clostridium sp.]|nr:hypothetical protein [Clostridium sp.]MCM1444210.1 hypothetical protein [Candidatus Amulumruptor caecigallinarius]